MATYWNSVPFMSGMSGVFWARLQLEANAEATRAELARAQRIMRDYDSYELNRKTLDELVPDGVELFDNPEEV